MFIFLLQLREAISGRPQVLVSFAAFALVVWAIWLLKVMLSRRYIAWLEPYETTASVIVPVVDEPVELFRDVLQRILKQEPHELIVVINGARNVNLEQVCADLGVHYSWTPTPGKRNAIRIGVELATGDVCVLVDSDTIWTDDTLTELVKPFADPSVGGVTTRQRILKAREHFLKRWADWMENSRARYSMPAQSSLGQVGCLPGRTIAFRRSILNHVMYDFMTQRFLGVFLEVSDDRTLTNLTLKMGFKTVYQASSLVLTDSPIKMKKLYKQQLRWARGSQYNTLRMLPWMVVHAPVLSIFFIADIILPFLLVGSVIGWTYHARTHTGVNFMRPTLDAFPGIQGWALVLGFIIVGSTVSMWLRQKRHLDEVPRDLMWMPVYILFSSIFLMPIRIYGFFVCGHVAKWGTRSGSYAGTEGMGLSQRLRSLNPQALFPYLLGGALIGVQIAAILQFQ
ncbi:glycosyltransferase family 2 [Caudovirales GX15bay]|nr:glycosyltransferase family 2 [Caudovirales GX15bay]